MTGFPIERKVAGAARSIVELLQAGVCDLDDCFGPEPPLVLIPDFIDIGLHVEPDVEPDPGDPVYRLDPRDEERIMQHGQRLVRETIDDWMAA